HSSSVFLTFAGTWILSFASSVQSANSRLRYGARQAPGAGSGALLRLELARLRGLGGEIGVLLEPVADDGALRGLHLVQPADRTTVRRLLQELRLLVCLARDR